jgi:predicted 3-demethylubiquinone-9 3-methyltransferase (glyoxalase superfamily)
MQKITPHLWFDDQAEEAAHFYISIFKNSKILHTMYYGKAFEGVSGKPAGSVMTVSFEIEGQTFVALNGGPIFQFSPAISFMVDCKTQEEVDTLWEKLLENGGGEQQCGWITDKFGVSWQIVPSALGEMISTKDPQKSERVMQAMMPMKKLDIAKLKAAYEGK